MKRFATGRLPGPNDLADMQGLLRSGFGRERVSRFLLLRVTEADAASAWLADLPVSSAVDPKPAVRGKVQIAFTAPGLAKFGLSGALTDGFPTEFLAGMDTDCARSRRLGDVGKSAPAHWRWGSGEQVPHAILLLYAREGGLERLVEEICDAQFVRGFSVMGELPTGLLSRDEAFGFADGVSQPTIDWDGRLRRARHGDVHYRNRIACGEFVLGYTDEYGMFAPRPLVDPESFPAAARLPRALDRPEQADLGRNGSYLVLRQIGQDVSAFWRFMDDVARGDVEARDSLAARIVGRDRAGKPLATDIETPIDGVAPADVRNRFDFADDPLGLRCPLGSHVRRANPRSVDWPPGTRGWFARLQRALGFGSRHLGEDLVASARFHRLLRRGRGYGPSLSPEVAIETDSSDAHGLQFLCLCTHIGRQFEFVQAAWLNNAQFAGLEAERDPLIGHRKPLGGGRATDGFTCPRRGAPAERIGGLPEFVQVLGGAYAFLPGRRAVAFIAEQGGRA